MSEPVYHVEPGSHGWTARSGSDKRTLGTYTTKQEAIDAARRALERLGDGHVVVHRADGSYELAWPQGRVASPPPA